MPTDTFRYFYQEGSKLYKPIVGLDDTGADAGLCGCRHRHLLAGVATFFSKKTHQLKKYSYFCLLNIWLKFNVTTVK
jgi:hypothetical protein